MNAALWISKTGLDAQQTSIDITANNLANASTVGHKRNRAVFETYSIKQSASQVDNQHRYRAANRLDERCGC